MPAGIIMADPALLRLMQLVSPSFPIGAYSYSHGLEWAVEDGRVQDRAGLFDWVDASLTFGPARSDGAFAAMAWRASDQSDQLQPILDHARAMRGTAELALESDAQGAACWQLAQSLWADRLTGLNLQPPYPIAALFGLLAARLDIGLEETVQGFLHAFAANLVSAGVRLIPLGQTDGQRALFDLEDAIAQATQFCLNAGLDDLGTATPMIDWASMRHETQYTRLFRS